MVLSQVVTQTMLRWFVEIKDINMTLNVHVLFEPK